MVAPRSASRPGDTQEDSVHVYIVEEFKSGISGERKRPRPGNDAAGQIGANTGLIAEFHADIDRVGDDLDLFPMTKTAADVGRCRSGGEANGLIGLNEFGGGKADAALFYGEFLFAREKGAVVAEWLVEKRFDQGCAAMRATNQTPIFETCQIPANTGSRGTRHCEDFFDTGCTGAEQKLDDQFTAAVQCLWHDANDSTRAITVLHRLCRVFVNFPTK